jgi:hypothetical protein
MGIGIAIAVSIALRFNFEFLTAEGITGRAPHWAISILFFAAVVYLFSTLNKRS